MDDPSQEPGVAPLGSKPLLSKQQLCELESYFRESFKKPSRGAVAKLLGDPAEYDYSIVRVELHPSDRQFRALSLNWIEVAAPFLEFTQLPSSKTRGLFATDSTGSWYLNGTGKAGITRLFAAEGSIASLPASTLAAVVCDGLLSNRDCRHRLIESFADVEAIANGFPIGAYAIDQKQAAAVKPKIGPAQLESCGDSSQLRFTTLSGWMHEAAQVNAVRVVIESDFSVDWAQEILTEAIFLRTPALRY